MCFSRTCFLRFPKDGYGTGCKTDFSDLRLPVVGNDSRVPPWHPNLAIPSTGHRELLTRLPLHTPPAFAASAFSSSRRRCRQSFLASKLCRCRSKLRSKPSALRRWPFSSWRRHGGRRDGRVTVGATVRAPGDKGSSPRKPGWN